jgi:hypothetical protein
MDDSPSSRAGNVVVRTNAWYCGDRYACPAQTGPRRPFLALPRVDRAGLQASGHESESGSVGQSIYSRRVVPAWSKL